MRKLLFIVLAFAACLLFSESGHCVRVPQQAARLALFSAGDTLADEWQCERAYNSDLNHQPRMLREAEACPTAPSFRHGGTSLGEHAAERCAALCGCGMGIAKLTSTFQSSDLSVGLHAVDYYVYRLRRLII